MASGDYWREWRPSWMTAFVEVDKACDEFLRDRTHWSLVKYRWDNPDRLLSGPLVDGFWGNIHILLVPEDSKFRFSYAAWRDVDLGVIHGLRVTRRFWSNSDDDGRGDHYLSLDDATGAIVKQTLDGAWVGLIRLSKQKKLREDLIKLPL
jgi:hypothetical protein